MQLSDAGEAPLKMEEMVYCEAVQQRGDLEAVPGCCKQLKLHTVVRIYRCGIQNLVSAGAKNRRQGGIKATQQGRKGQKNQTGRTEDMVGAVECAGGPWGADGDHDERSTRWGREHANRSSFLTLSC